MNITKEQTGDLNALLTITVEPADYNPKVQSSLKNMSKQVSMKGFRKGMVPIGLVKKMYGQQVLVEELDKILQEQLNSYLKENNIEILGNPLPTDNEAFNFDVTNAEAEYTFSYELGLQPEFSLDFINKDTEVNKYKVTVDDKTLEEELTRLRKRFGNTTNPEEGVQEDDVLVVDLKELDADGNEKEGGKTNEDVALAMDMVTEKQQKALKELKVGGAAKVNLFELMDKSREEIGKHLLNLKADELEGVNDEFNLTLKKINRMEPAALDQQLFDTVFGEGEVDSADAFKEKIREEIGKAFDSQSEQRLGYDIVNALLDKAEMPLPDDFLKRWIKRTNEKPITDEQLENEFEGFTRNLKWSLVVNKLSKEHDIKVEVDEIKDHTREQILQQFGNLGGNFPEEQMDQFVNSMLQNQERVQKTYEALLDKKLIDHLKEQVTLKEKEVSLDEFSKLDQ